MVKGISRQVIVVHSPDPQLFDQAIFILKDGVVEQGVTDEMLLREARQAIQRPVRHKKGYGLVCGAFGAALTGTVWLLSALL